MKGDPKQGGKGLGLQWGVVREVIMDLPRALRFSFAKSPHKINLRA